MASSFARLGGSRTDLEAAMADRLKDADVLWKGRRYASSIAMALYALEIALKVAICKRLDLEALPAVFEVHDFQGLLFMSGLSSRLGRPGNEKVRENWDILTALGPRQTNDLRYRPSSERGRKECAAILEALRDETEGVLTWITMHS